MKNYKFNTLPDLLKEKKWLYKANKAEKQFTLLRDKVCNHFQNLENAYNCKNDLPRYYFKKNRWSRNKNNNEFGGGLSSILKGNLFEKVGVNVSTVSGIFPEIAIINSL